MAPQENSFKVGDLLVPTTFPISSIFGRLRVDLTSPAPIPPPLVTACSSRVDQIGSQISNSNLQPTSHTCAKCLASGHRASSCRAPWRCLVCRKFVHKAHWCRTKTKPNIFWATKQTQQWIPKKPASSQPSTDTQAEAQVENIEELVPPEDSQSDFSHLFFGESRLEP
jgi:hypothetical protein